MTRQNTSLWRLSCRSGWIDYFNPDDETTEKAALFVDCNSRFGKKFRMIDEADEKPGFFKNPGF
ncbi:MAG: hypothetical protein CMJ78_07540 [Planctomycetaceae bacterium]|nr:hypothetical protein [Planctomycetaceae bacterium]